MWLKRRYRTPIRVEKNLELTESQSVLNGKFLSKILASLSLINNHTEIIEELYVNRNHF